MKYKITYKECHIIDNNVFYIDNINVFDIPNFNLNIRYIKHIIMYDCGHPRHPHYLNNIVDVKIIDIKKIKND